MNIQVVTFWVMAPCSDVKREAAWPSKMLVFYHITIWCDNPEDYNVNTQ